VPAECQSSLPASICPIWIPESSCAGINHLFNNRIIEFGGSMFAAWIFELDQSAPGARQIERISQIVRVL
jgi:hypothetical protein